MHDIDRWALSRLNKLSASVGAAYERYEFHTIYHAIHNFCAVDMSNFYLDVIKDRLYCEGRHSLGRRAAQSAMYVILDALTRMLAPILAFTSEEIWGMMQHTAGREYDSVLLNPMPEPNPAYDLPPGREAVWDNLLRLRADVNKALELARVGHDGETIGKSLEADVTLVVGDEAEAAFKDISVMDLKTLFIVSSVCIKQDGIASEGYEGTEFKGVTIAVKPSGAPKCARCWIHDADVGKNAEHPGLCPRCLGVVTGV
jgi:isoleucyl-tRNA synthetase